MTKPNLKQFASLCVLMFASALAFGQSTVTGVIPQYANGSIKIVTGTIQGRGAIDGQGNFSFQVVSSPTSHVLTFTAPAGSPYQPFTLTVTAGPGVTNITSQLVPYITQIGIYLGIKSAAAVGTDQNGNAIPTTGGSIIPCGTMGGIVYWNGVAYACSPGTIDSGGNFATPGSISSGPTPPTGCGSASSCWGFNESSAAGTPTAAQDYWYVSSSTHLWTWSLNGAAESSVWPVTQGGTNNTFGGSANTIEASGSPLTVPVLTGSWWNNTASTYSFKLPVPVSGLRQCFGNYQARSGAVSVIPSTGVTIYLAGVAGTAGSATGLVSTGAAGDRICVIGTDATTYMAEGPGTGWTNH